MAGTLISGARLTTPQTGDMFPMARPGNTTARYATYPAGLLGYTEYIALLTQSDTNAPSAVEIKNDTGATVTWSYVSTGVYSATFSSAVLTANKTIGIITGASFNRVYRGSWMSTTVYRIVTGSTLSALNDVLSSTPVIIRIYV